MRDGDEVFVNCRLVFAYQEADESVGIHGGFFVTDLVFDDGSRIEIERVLTETHYGMKRKDTTQLYVYKLDTKGIDKLCDDLTEGELNLQWPQSDED